MNNLIERRGAGEKRAQFRRGLLRAALALGAATLAGCATGDELYQLQEDPAYAGGYADGCTTAGEEIKSFSSKKVRDAYQFENSRGYRAGWRQGYLQCKQQHDPSDGGRVLGDEPGF